MTRREALIRLAATFVAAGITSVARILGVDVGDVVVDLAAQALVSLVAQEVAGRLHRRRAAPSA